MTENATLREIAAKIDVYRQTVLDSGVSVYAKLVQAHALCRIADALEQLAKSQTVSPSPSESRQDPEAPRTAVCANCEDTGIPKGWVDYFRKHRLLCNCEAGKRLYGAAYEPLPNYDPGESIRRNSEYMRAHPDPGTIQAPSEGTEAKGTKD